MKNAVGREIPDELLVNNKRVYSGKNQIDGQYEQKVGPKRRIGEKPREDKLVATLRETCEKCGVHDGMTISFHSVFRNGDYVAAMAVKTLVEELGVKDLKIAATSLGSAHDIIADYIEKGVVTVIQTSGVRGRIGEVISAGKHRLLFAVMEVVHVLLPPAK